MLLQLRQEIMRLVSGASGKPQTVFRDQNTFEPVPLLTVCPAVAALDIFAQGLDPIALFTPGAKLTWT